MKEARKLMGEMFPKMHYVLELQTTVFHSAYIQRKICLNKLAWVTCAFISFVVYHNILFVCMDGGICCHCSVALASGLVSTHALIWLAFLPQAIVSLVHSISGCVQIGSADKGLWGQKSHSGGLGSSSDQNTHSCRIILCLWGLILITDKCMS